MTLVSSIITGVVALLGVLLGGIITIRNQERLWVREHERQWRDIRLRVFEDFIAACRGTVAYISSPDAKIKSAPHPQRQGDSIPFYDEIGTPIRERMDAAVTKIRLISSSSETANSAHQMVFSIRDLAAARATYVHDEMPHELWLRVFENQQKFLLAARNELNLPELSESGRDSDAESTILVT